MPNKYYRLQASYRLPNTGTSDVIEEDERLVDIVGMAASDSGAGFGWRDLGWRFDLRTPAEVIAEKLRAAGYKVSITSYEEKP